MNKIIIIIGNLVLIVIVLVAAYEGWMNIAGIGGVIVGISTIVSTIYTAKEYHGSENERKLQKEDREKQQNIHKRQMEPVIDFGLSLHGDGSDTPMVEITVSDQKEMLRNPEVSVAHGIFNGLNIAKRGQKCLPHQFRIAARVPKDDQGVIKFSYEDIEGNKYEKFISWNPILDVKDEI